MSVRRDWALMGTLFILVSGRANESLSFDEGVMQAYPRFSPTRRRWVIAAAVALVVIAAGMLYARTNRTGRFSHSNYQRIQNGMSREQVAELLGSFGEETKSIPNFPLY